MTDHLETLLRGPAAKRRGAIEALAADLPRREAILDALADVIAAQSAIVHQPTPDGLKAGQAEKYAVICEAAVVQQAAAEAVLGILGPDGLLDSERFRGLIDRTGMLNRLARWDQHLQCMWSQGLQAAERFRTKHPGARIVKVKIFGLGGSAAPHDIVAEIISNSRKSATEIQVVHADQPHTDYVDHHTLAILSSFSGNTEETINCYETLKARTELLAALTKGGQLRRLAQAADIPLMQIPEKEAHPAFVMQPRESLCLQMTASLVFLADVGLSPGSAGGFAEADLQQSTMETLLRSWRDRFGPELAFGKNPAKQLAAFLLFGRDVQDIRPFPRELLWRKKVPFVLADRNHAAIAHEVRTQLHERSKLNAACYEAPECLHNLVESIRAGTDSSRGGLDDDPWVYYFLRSPDEEPRIRFRLDRTIELVLKEKARYAVLNLEGTTAYQRAMFATYFNAHLTTYLAVLNGFDPLPVPTMSWIKNVMAASHRDGPEERQAIGAARPLLQMHGK